jgi:hypothetical protein
MSGFLTYLLIGTTFTFIQDTLIKTLGTEEFTNVERVVLIFIWPIGLLLSVYYFIKTFFGR